MKTALVWGATGGMGRAIVKKLTEEGWDIVGVSRGSGNFTVPVKEVKVSDIGNPDAVAKSMKEAREKLDGVDLWVYAVGDITSKKISNLEPEDWNRIIETNLKGAYLATKFSIPLLAENAHMIFLGAVSERVQFPGLSAYAAAKSGLESFVEVLRKEERKRVISIIRPKAVDTPLWDKLPLNLPHGAKKPSEVAERVLSVYQEGKEGKIDI